MQALFVSLAVHVFLELGRVESFRGGCRGCGVGRVCGVELRQRRLARRAEPPAGPVGEPCGPGAFLREKDILFVCFFPSSPPRSPLLLRVRFIFKYKLMKLFFFSSKSCLRFFSRAAISYLSRQVPVDRFFALRDAVQALVPSADVGSVSDSAEDVTSQCVRARLFFLYAPSSYVFHFAAAARP